MKVIVFLFLLLLFFCSLKKGGGSEEKSRHAFAKIQVFSVSSKRIKDEEEKKSWIGLERTHVFDGHNSVDIAFLSKYR